MFLSEKNQFQIFLKILEKWMKSHFKIKIFQIEIFCKKCITILLFFEYILKKNYYFYIFTYKQMEKSWLQNDFSFVFQDLIKKFEINFFHFV